MASGVEGSDPDAATKQAWHDSKIYQALTALDRAAWAWEWLRRNPFYTAMAAGARSASLRVLRPAPLIAMITLPGSEDGASRWGLHFCREAGPRRGSGADFLARRLRRNGASGLGEQGRAVRSGSVRPRPHRLFRPYPSGPAGIEHLLIGDATHHLRLDVIEGTVLDGRQYAGLYRAAYGQAESVAELIPFMLGAFLDSDKGFAKARKEALLDAPAEPERRRRGRRAASQPQSSTSTEK